MLNHRSLNLQVMLVFFCFINHSELLFLLQLLVLNKVESCHQSNFLIFMGLCVFFV